MDLGAMPELPNGFGNVGRALEGKLSKKVESGYNVLELSLLALRLPAARSPDSKELWARRGTDC